MVGKTAGTLAGINAVSLNGSSSYSIPHHHILNVKQNTFTYECLWMSSEK